MSIIEFQHARQHAKANRSISRESAEHAAVIGLDHAKALDNTSHVRVTIDTAGNVRIDNNINSVHADTMADALTLVLSRARKAKLDGPIRHYGDCYPGR